MLPLPVARPTPPALPMPHWWWRIRNCAIFCPPSRRRLARVSPSGGRLESPDDARAILL
ncbi:hypothetical protein PGTUg99_006889 [Puccinia graminis f. sp. tritici]|uniref:Uncharacterized protein n=1 Tax=Puccinia graminis f. sp. tritici TaxID=56615 RepID=A0A5B0QGP2_PUCGR|nr:hypothetical protein PGTUg99_006889 [Puccinia graminis f. sp. tritici]